MVEGTMGWEGGGGDRVMQAAAKWESQTRSDYLVCSVNKLNGLFRLMWYYNEQLPACGGPKVNVLSILFVHTICMPTMLTT